MIDLLTEFMVPGDNHAAIIFGKRYALQTTREAHKRVSD